MNDITLILLAAGSSTRFGLPVKKQWLYQHDRPLWLKVADDFRNSFDFAEIVITASEREVLYMRYFSDDMFIAGGKDRKDSLANALKHVDTPFVLVSDVARCCLDIPMIEGVILHKGEADVIVPALAAVDTVYHDKNPVDRNGIKLIQTPQLSRTEILKSALKLEGEFTDESSAVKAAGGSIMFVDGSAAARKLTSAEDLGMIPCLKPPSSKTFNGYGIDTHGFSKDKPMVIGGVNIDSDFGFKAHSDGDVAIHALIDAILGAAGMGDIGEFFPDNDARYAGADSAEMLRQIVSLIQSVGLELIHADLTIVTEIPRISPYKDAIRRSLSDILGISRQHMNIKATTSEKMGFIGRKEGTTVHATATLGYFNWTEKI